MPRKSATTSASAQNEEKKTAGSKKPAAPAAAAAPKAPARAPARAKASEAVAAALDPSSDDFRRQVSEAAYYLAERRGFEPGFEDQDWLQAEAELLKRINEGQAAR